VGSPKEIINLGLGRDLNLTKEIKTTGGEVKAGKGKKISSMRSPHFVDVTWWGTIERPKKVRACSQST